MPMSWPQQVLIHREISFLQASLLYILVTRSISDNTIVNTNFISQLLSFPNYEGCPTSDSKVRILGEGKQVNVKTVQRVGVCTCNNAHYLIHYTMARSLDLGIYFSYFTLLNCGFIWKLKSQKWPVTVRQILSFVPGLKSTTCLSLF